MKTSLLGLAFLAIFAIASDVGAAETTEEWWQYGNFYQIYPRSFQDSDGDGIGDLNGITSRLDYIKFLGVNAIWLSPIFQSPMKDFGYDISDYRAIHAEYGTMQDFENLVKRCKQLGIKLILDFVPNHTSDQHEWFKKSKAGDEKYKDYYVWEDGKDSKTNPPSNWQSLFGGSAWKLDSTRNQYYLHQFLEEQPDLNYRNPEVKKEMIAVLKFWLDKGVDGFRCDAVGFTLENNADHKYIDEERREPCEAPYEYYCLIHTETYDLSESLDVIYEWRAFTDTYKDSPRILMTEVYTTLPNTQKYYGKTDSNNQITEYGAQVPFNFELIMYTNYMSKASDFKKHITEWLDAMPKGDKMHANWVLGNHDNARIASKYGVTRVDLLNILTKTLPGIAVTYNGEEIGMVNVHISWEDTVDPQACNAGKDNYEGANRDPERTPFQWDDSKNSGFSSAAKTWLPLAPNYATNNVKVQALQLNSHLNMFRRLLLLRENPTMKYGEFVIEVLNDDKVLAYKREIEGDSAKGKDVIVVLMNIVNYNQTVSLKSINAFGILPSKMDVVVVSAEAKNYFIGDSIDTENSNVELEGDIGIVLMGSK